jgi:hypothetical protein
MADYDVVIIGSGLAGLTAGLFAARHGLAALVLEANIPGGHLNSIEKIEDFPGFPEGIAGYDLCPTVQRQAADQGAEFQRAEVQSLESEDRFWSVIISEDRHRAKAVIVATGSTLKNLGIPGEEKLTGRGVSHCASCDGPLYNGRTVGVVGGGDSALQEALTVAAFFGREPHKTWFKKGFTRPLVQTGRKRDALLPETPTFYELMDRYKTSDAGRRLATLVIAPNEFGRPWTAPPGMAADRLKILREAWNKTLRDPELLTEARKRTWPVEPAGGEELATLAKQVIDQPPDVVQRLKKLLGE